MSWKTKEIELPKCVCVFGKITLKLGAHVQEVNIHVCLVSI